MTKISPSSNFCQHSVATGQGVCRKFRVICHSRREKFSILLSGTELLLR